MANSNGTVKSNVVQLQAGHNGHFNVTSGSSTHSNLMSNSFVQANLNHEEIPFETLIFNEGDTLFAENEKPKGIYLLKSGCVKIFVHRDNNRGRTTSPDYVTKLVAPGEIFGYKGVVSQSNTRAFAKAVKPSTVWFYDAKVVGQMISKMHPMLRSILEQSVNDLQNFDKMNQLHYLASVQERIAYQLVVLSDRFGTKVADGISLNLKLTRNEFAQLASTINESLSRHLTEFKNEGLIDINGKEIIIKNREGLAAKSGSF